MKTLKLIVTVAMVSSALFFNTNVFAKERETGRGTGPVIYVESSGLFYDSIVLADLPNVGNFQELITGVGPAISGLRTAVGPGEEGFYGGRWWIDANGNGDMDDGDKYFLCPLLGPGRESE